MAIELSAGQPRKLLDGVEVFRDHVFGQPLAQSLRQSPVIHAVLAFGRDDERSEFLDGAVHPYGDRSGAHARLLAQGRFDLGQLDAEAPDLDERVLPAHELQLALACPPDKIIRAVEALVSETRFIERVRNEPIARQLGPVEIAARHAGAADKQLADLAACDGP